MDFRIFTIDHIQVLLERFQEDEEWSIMVSVFIDKALRYDEWIHCDSAEQARQHIAHFPEYEVNDFLTRANEWAAKEYQRLEDKTRFIEPLEVYQQRKRLARS